jgi:hypothetical protein
MCFLLLTVVAAYFGWRFRAEIATFIKGLRTK